MRLGQEDHTGLWCLSSFMQPMLFWDPSHYMVLWKSPSTVKVVLIIPCTTGPKRFHISGPGTESSKIRSVPGHPLKGQERRKANKNISIHWWIHSITFECVYEDLCVCARAHTHQTWRCSRHTPGSAVREHSWHRSEDHMEWRRLNLGRLHAAKYLTLHTIATAPALFISKDDESIHLYVNSVSWMCCRNCSHVSVQSAQPSSCVKLRM